ncbi:MAG: hypothetical protein HY288_19285 [Planctomycetia bacterium]|nr:hypothetical protein [Planctomycetia bacterium]
MNTTFGRLASAAKTAPKGQVINQPHSATAGQTWRAVRSRGTIDITAGPFEVIQMMAAAMAAILPGADRPTPSTPKAIKTIANLLMVIDISTKPASYRGFRTNCFAGFDFLPQDDQKLLEENCHATWSGGNLSSQMPIMRRSSRL